jgi:tryptophan 6-halogenase
MAINQPTVDSSAYYTSFDLEFDNFWTNGSYYAIFAGLGVLPEHPLPLLAYKTGSREAAESFFTAIKREQKSLVSTLPTAYQFLRKLHRKDGGTGQSICTLREANEAINPD